MPGAAVIIPARYGSSRFPGKLLCPLGGRPLILHVLAGALQARLPAEVIVATDDGRIRDAVESAGGLAVMTRPDHESGTDRVAEVAAGLSYDIIINIQGDEPFIRGEAIDDLIRILEGDSSAGMATMARRLESAGEVNDPNIVKVVLGQAGQALYFSRSPIPYYRDAPEAVQGRAGFSGLTGDLYLGHIGVYGYRREVLARLSGAPPCALERAERLEQLRALYLGIVIKVKETAFPFLGVDTPGDLEEAEKWLNSSS